MRWYSLRPSGSHTARPWIFLFDVPMLRRVVMDLPVDAVSKNNFAIKIEASCLRETQRRILRRDWSRAVDVGTLDQRDPRRAGCVTFPTSRVMQTLEHAGFIQQRPKRSDMPVMSVMQTLEHAPWISLDRDPCDARCAVFMMEMAEWPADR